MSSCGDVYLSLVSAVYPFIHWSSTHWTRLAQRNYCKITRRLCAFNYTFYSYHFHADAPHSPTPIHMSPIPSFRKGMPMIPRWKYSNLYSLVAFLTSPLDTGMFPLRRDKRGPNLLKADAEREVSRPGEGAPGQWSLLNHAVSGAVVSLSCGQSVTDV